MDIRSTDHLLTTTRSVRRRLDFERPVAPELIEECVTIALQAPTGRASWHFVVVTDAAKKEAVAGYYRNALTELRAMNPDSGPGKPTMQYLADNLHRCPALIIPCIEGRPESLPRGRAAGLYGSIMPAAWSLMLALRTRGLGTVWTSLHTFHEREIAEVLGIPEDVTQAALFPVAHIIGDDNFKAVDRGNPAQIIHWNTWE